jgi:hypothetical protein
MNGFIDHLYTPLGTTSNYSATADLHTLQITTAPAKPFPACYVLTSRFLATTSNSGDSSASHAQVLLSQPPVQNSCQLSKRHPSFQSSTELPTLNQLSTVRLVAISHQTPSLLFTAQLSTEHRTLNWQFWNLTADSQLSQFNSAGLGSSLYSLEVDPTENTTSNSFSILVMGICPAIASILLTCSPSVAKQRLLSHRLFQALCLHHSIILLYLQFLGLRIYQHFTKTLWFVCMFQTSV